MYGYVWVRSGIGTDRRIGSSAAEVYMGICSSAAEVDENESKCLRRKSECPVHWGQPDRKGVHGLYRRSVSLPYQRWKLLLQTKQRCFLCKPE